MTASVAEVAVTLPVPGRYHYLVPAAMEGRARVGARVLVRFGNQKVTGVVVPPVSKPPVGIKLVELSDVLDDEPSLSPELVDLCLWVADYYEAPPGEVMRAALPAGSGVAAQQLVSLTDAGRASMAGDGSALPAKLHALLARIGDGAMPMAGPASPSAEAGRSPVAVPGQQHGRVQLGQPVEGGPGLVVVLVTPLMSSRGPRRCR